MALSNSVLAYEDVKQVMDRALDSDVGMAISFDRHGSAIAFRQRVYKFRNLTRNISRAAFEENDARYGVCAYDTLVAILKPKIPGEPWVVELRKIDNMRYDMREIKI